MRGILVLAVLTVKSSYSQNVELSVAGADDVPDTVQWWAWRTRLLEITHIRNRP